MNNEWRDLPTMADVAAAQVAGDQIEIYQLDGWKKWKGVAWNANWTFRARSMPKVKKVKILGWWNPNNGRLFAIADGEAVDGEWIRYPELDKEIEVPE